MTADGDVSRETRPPVGFNMGLPIPRGKPEAEAWLAGQPKLPNGKVHASLVMDEGKRRGYCICPRPMRIMVSFEGMTCQWCGQPETAASHEFWYGKP